MLVSLDRFTHHGDALRNSSKWLSYSPLLFAADWPTELHMPYLLQIFEKHTHILLRRTMNRLRSFVCRCLCCLHRLSSTP